LSLNLTFFGLNMTTKTQNGESMNVGVVLA
jgi:hypothetical protein